MSDVLLRGEFLRSARGFTFGDSTGVTWTFDAATVVGAVYFNTVSGVEYLNIHDNRARMADSSKNKVGGSVTVTARIEHNNGWNVGLRVTDGVTAPSTESSYANIYVDTADGDLKVKFGDGMVKTIVVDT